MTVSHRSPARAALSLAAALVLGGGLLAGCRDATPSVAGASDGPSSGVVAPDVAYPGGIAPGTQFTPVTTTVTDPPQPVLGTDGQVHLAYELLLTNATAAPVTMTLLQVRDATTHRPLTTLNAGQLATSVTPLSGPASSEGVSSPPGDPQPTVIPPSSTWIAWLDVTVPSYARVPAQLEHYLAYTIGSRGFTAVSSTVTPGTTAPVVLTPPVPNGTWYMSEGCCSDYTHHRWGIAPINGALDIPQRFAIDFYALDDQHRAWVGDPTQLTSFLSYRKPVIAAADGVVVESTDGLPNNPDLPKPPPIPPINQTVGNHVIERVAPGVFVLYAHMDPGSVQVHAGDRVTRGTQLGRIGTSGNSTLPHLHFQILTTPTFFPSVSKPWVLDRFRLLGSITERLWDDNMVEKDPSGQLPFAPDPNPGVRRDQLPLDRTVVRFGS